MPVLLRYISGPVLAIIFSFAFPEFHTLRYDPMMVAGFILSILGISIMLVGFVMPRYYNIFVPPHRQMEGMEGTLVGVDKEEAVEELEKEKADGATVVVKRSEAVEA